MQPTWTARLINACGDSGGVEAFNSKNWAGGLTSCNEESGNGPSLGCAVLEENGHTKGESGFLLFGSLSLVILVR